MIAIAKMMKKIRASDEYELTDEKNGFLQCQFMNPNDCRMRSYSLLVLSCSFFKGGGGGWVGGRAYGTRVRSKALKYSARSWQSLCYVACRTKFPSQMRDCISLNCRSISSWVKWSGNVQARRAGMLLMQTTRPSIYLYFSQVLLIIASQQLQQCRSSIQRATMCVHHWLKKTISGWGAFSCWRTYEALSHVPTLKGLGPSLSWI